MSSAELDVWLASWR